jgi:hypothetical protein
MDYTELARVTVDFLKPYLAAAGGTLVQDSLSAAREQVFGWLKRKFTKPAQTGALEEAAQSPQDAGALEALQLQIRRALEQQEDFRKELLERLPQEVLPPSLVQTLNQSGEGNLGIQNTGSGNTFNVQR